VIYVNVIVIKVTQSLSDESIDDDDDDEQVFDRLSAACLYLSLSLSLSLSLCVCVCVCVNLFVSCRNFRLSGVTMATSCEGGKLDACSGGNISRDDTITIARH